MFAPDGGNQVQVDWEQELVVKVKEVKNSMLEIARYYWGFDMNEKYKQISEGPVKLELHHVFCEMQGIKG